MLYLVATPIGNMKDVTLRALEVLHRADVILCEDTRHTGKLLSHYNIKKTLLSFHEHNAARRIPEILNMLRQGQRIALAADAGTPTISDPGYKLVRECIQQKIRVEAIPGASAVLTSLVVSGMPSDKFLFLGYLPKRRGQRRKLFQNLKDLQQHMKTTCIAFETPHRLLKSLADLYGAVGDIDIVICRELTKLHEEVRREKLNQSLKHFQRTKPKGEFTLVFRLVI